MNCKDAVLAIEARLDGEIDSSERLELETHLAGCPSCKREVDERRAFADQLGRSLYFALKTVSPMPAEKSECVDRLVDGATRRKSWITIPRAAAALVITAILGAAMVSLGLLDGASAEVRELALLKSRREGYGEQVVRVENDLKKTAQDLDARVAASPKGPLRDVAAMSVASTAARLSGRKSELLPANPRECVRALTGLMAQKTWDARGRAVWGFKDLDRRHVVFLKEALQDLPETDRTFVEMVLQSVEGTGDAVIHFNVVVDDQTITLQQFPNSTVRLEQVRAGAAKIRMEGRCLADFTAKYPDAVKAFGIDGVDGDLFIGGLHLKGPEAAVRSTHIIQDLVWTSEGLQDGVVENALLTELCQHGMDVEDAVKKVKATLQKAPAIRVAVSVEPDSARLRRHIKAAGKLDPATLRHEREIVEDEIEQLRNRIEEMSRHLASLEKIRITMDARK